MIHFFGYPVNLVQMGHRIFAPKWGEKWPKLEHGHASEKTFSLRVI